MGRIWAHCGEHDGFAHGAMLLKVMLSRLSSGGDQVSFCSVLSMVLLNSTSRMRHCTAACATPESSLSWGGREQSKQDCLHRWSTLGVMEKATISLALPLLAPCCSFRLVPS